MKNFGLIKTIFTNIMADALVSENDKGKKLFNNYVNKVKKNKVLRTQFDVYELLENANGIEDSNIELYVKESISLLDGISRETIIMENLKLFKPIIENYPHLEDIEYPEKSLHEAISELMFVRKNAKTINSIIKNTNTIKESIKSNLIIENANGSKLNNRQIPNSLFTKLMVERFKEEYGSFNDTEKLVFMSLVKEDVDFKNETHSYLIKECLVLVNVKMSEDPSLKESLLNVKEKLLAENFSADNYKNSIVKILELYNDLN